MRAECFAQIRTFFTERGVLEVDTPILGSATVSDLHVHSLQAASLATAHHPLAFLQTSPESAMKRLLADDAYPIFQLCKVFRDDLEGPLHRREFWLLEWYRPGMDHLQLMDEVEEFIDHLLGNEPVQRESYADVFARLAGIDVNSVSGDELRGICCETGLAGELTSLSREDCLDYLFAQCIQPQLPGRWLIFDFPSTQAALAKTKPTAPAIAERFELIIDGVELANGYHELQEPAELLRRHTRDSALRRQASLAEIEIDRHLLSAMRHGLPACAGVAVGVDRLLMLAGGHQSLNAVMPFASESASG